MARGRSKGRTEKTYQRKLERLKKWHAKRVEARKKWNKDKLEKKKPLKPLEWYIEQLKSPVVREKKSSSITSSVRPTGGFWGR